MGAVEVASDKTDVGAPDVDDDALVRMAQEDRSSFDVLYRRYVNRIYRYVRTRVEYEQDALDLTQLVFVRAFEALPRYRPSAPFGAWLFRIARNAINDHHRRRKPSVSWDFLPANLVPTSREDPAETASRNESLREMREVVAELDAYRRELLLLRFAGELTTREIALVLGKREGDDKVRHSADIAAHERID
jgi:RNA polymerase sigma-70 factor, ECF subfamily